MTKIEKNYKLSNIQASLLITLRMLLGWYFLYEGITKIVNPDWSSFSYLMDSQGPFAVFFQSMAANPKLIAVVDFLNMWGLTLIGFGLMLGVFTQLSAGFGVLLLVLYYFSHPPLASVNYIMPQEGSYLIVNKTLIEIFAMAVILVFPTGHIFGLDRLIIKWIKK